MYRARKHDGWCGPISLSIVYKHYEKKMKRGRIAKQMRMWKGGTTFDELGIHALRNGFDVTVLTADFSRHKDACLKKFRRYVENKTNRLGHFEGARLPLFLQNGGKIKVGLKLTPRLLRDLVKKHAPIIFGVAAGVYVRAYKLEVGHARRGKMHHFTVGVGLKGDDVVLYDPEWGEIHVSLEILSDSLREHHSGGTIILMTKKRT